MREQNCIEMLLSFKHQHVCAVCVPLQVPYVKVAPEDILKVQVPRFTTLDLRPTNTDISLAVAGLLTFFNSTTSCLICAQADCKCCIRALATTVRSSFRTHAASSPRLPTKCERLCLISLNLPTPLSTHMRATFGQTRRQTSWQQMWQQSAAPWHAPLGRRSHATAKHSTTHQHPRTNCRVHCRVHYHY